jgi:ferredoxin
MITAILARSQRKVHIRADQTILAAPQEADFDVPYSCTEGVCGTCETRVLAGRPDHRDHVLSASERAQGQMMMICVSRSLDPTLALDL